MISSLLTIFFILLFLFVLVVLIKGSSTMYNDYDDEIVTTHTTTTTTTVNEPKTQVFDYEIVGILTRKKTKNQYYVIDPVDGDKVWLNDNDDMYEDGAGKIWRLK